MDDESAQQIEKYQILYQKNPKSKIFATLAEIYRKNSMYKEALAVSEKGVLDHPDFPGGRVALAKVYLDLNRPQDATSQLETTVDLAPDNILAHSLLGECYLKLRQAKKALSSYKMVLLLNANDPQAQMAVKKLESLTADDYGIETFEMHELKESLLEQQLDHLEQEKKPKPILESRKIERYVSLADAFIVRNDLSQAMETLNEALRDLGEHVEIRRRIDLLRRRQTESLEVIEEIRPTPDRSKTLLDDKIQYLQDLLQFFEEKSSSQPTSP